MLTGRVFSAWVSEDRVFQLLLHARLFKSDPGIGRACIVVSLRETALFLWKGWRQERFFRRELRGVSVNPIREVYGWVWVYEIEQTANRRESRKPSACSQNRICLSSLSQSSFAVLLIPHRERSGKSCRRPSGSRRQFLSPSHFAIVKKELLSSM